ncbi:uncharacterized protein LODBEIA_P55440 [Lodderomyces beijingensis]|uniref:Uncharacterized protein n=1 Tax=Lodderomyces beijingensis TaxID=1775926 RepID=A0ABP0ZT58_9ASCO
MPLGFRKSSSQAVQDNATISTKSSSQSTKSGSFSKSSRTSSSSSSSTTSKKQEPAKLQMIMNGKLWVFDYQINMYVEHTESAYDITKKQYNSYLKGLMKSTNFKTNDRLNESVVGNLRNLQLLRHTYFEELKYDDKVARHIGESEDSYCYIKEIKQATDIKHGNEKEAESSFPSLSLQEEGSHNEPHNTSKANIRSILSSCHFWNNCYQDIKFDSMSNGESYYDLLPNTPQATAFYIEYIDYLLINLHILKPALDDITDAREFARLSKIQFVFYNDLNHEFLKIMKNEHDRMYELQKELNNVLDEEINYRFIYQKLVDALVQNILTFHPEIPDDILQIWDDFFHFMFHHMLIPPASKFVPNLSKHSTLPKQANSSSSSTTPLSSTTGAPPRPTRPPRLSIPRNLSPNLSIGSAASMDSVMSTRNKRHGSVMNDVSSILTPATTAHSPTHSRKGTACSGSLLEVSPTTTPTIEPPPRTDSAWVLSHADSFYVVGYKSDSRKVQQERAKQEGPEAVEKLKSQRSAKRDGPAQNGVEALERSVRNKLNLFKSRVTAASSASQAKNAST